MDFEIIELLKNESKVNGLRQVLRGIRKGKIDKVLLATDADYELVKEIDTICHSNNIPLLTCPSKDELGREVNIKRACSVVGFLTTES